MLLRSRVELVDVTELGGGGASDLNAIINPGFFSRYDDIYRHSFLFFSEPKMSRTVCCNKTQSIMNEL